MLTAHYLPFYTCLVWYLPFVDCKVVKTVVWFTVYCVFFVESLDVFLLRLVFLWPLTSGAHDGWVTHEVFLLPLFVWATFVSLKAEKLGHQEKYVFIAHIIEIFITFNNLSTLLRKLLSSVATCLKKNKRNSVSGFVYSVQTQEIYTSCGKVLCD